MRYINLLLTLTNVMQVGDGSVITGKTSGLWVELLFLQRWGDRRCFVTSEVWSEHWKLR